MLSESERKPEAEETRWQQAVEEVLCGDSITYTSLSVKQKCIAERDLRNHLACFRHSMINDFRGSLF